MGIAESPAQVGITGGAEGDLPAVSWKPSEFDRGRSCRRYPHSLAEAAKLKGEAGRVEKGVLVLIVDPNRLI